MRLSLRFVIPLILVLTAFAYGVSPLIDRITLRWFVRDLDIRSQLIANTISEPLFEQLAWLVLVHDMSFVQRRSEETKRYVLYSSSGSASAVVSLHHGGDRPALLARLDQAGMRSLLRGEGLLRDPGQGRWPRRSSADRARPARLIREMETEIARATKRRSPGRRKRCAPSCAANCAARM
jgi:hypothetical protein